MGGRKVSHEFLDQLSLLVEHHQDLPAHLAHPLIVHMRIQRGTVTCPKSHSDHQNPGLLPPRLFPASEAIHFGGSFTYKTFRGGFCFSLPAYHGLAHIKILFVGVSAIIHFFPNGMLASDKEPWGRQEIVSVSSSLASA